MNRTGNVVRTILLLTMLVMIWFGMNYKTIIVDGPSMEPTLLGGDYVICRYYKNDSPQVGDVVIVNPSKEKFSRGLIVKRVGSIVEGSGYMVYGDNRDESIDSREFGAVSRKEIVGKVIYRVFPLSTKGSIR